MNIDMTRWINDVENIMARKERVAERLAIQRLKDLEAQIDDLDVNSDEEFHAKPNKASGNELLDGYEEGEMVFGNNSYKASQMASAAAGSSGGDKAADSEGFVYYDDESEDDQVGNLSAAFKETPHSSGARIAGGGGVSTASSIASSNREPKREHKRLKHWGKKNKKNQDKDPYSEYNGVVSYVAYTTNRNKVGGEKWDQVHLQGSSKTAGSLFTRQKLPFTDPALAPYVSSAKPIPAARSADAQPANSNSTTGV
jgi:hypothetical protein